MKRYVAALLCTALIGWAFPLHSQDLSVTSMTPADGSVSVAHNTTISVEFNKELQDISLGVDLDEVLMLIPSPMNKRASISIKGNTLSIKVQLAPNQDYQVLVAGKVLRGADNSTLGRALVHVGVFSTGRLIPSGSISGTVTPYYPFATAAGYVIAYNPAIGQDEDDRPVRIAEVNSSGAYTLSNLTDGPYLLEASQFPGLDTEEGISSRAAETATVSNGQATTGRNITMTQLEVVSSIPEDGALNVATSTTVSITFSEAIETHDGRPSLDVSFFPPTESIGEPTISEDGRTVSAQVQLAADTFYKMGIFDARGTSGSRIVDPVYIVFSTGATIPEGSIAGHIANLSTLPLNRRIVAGVLYESGKMGSPVNVAADGSYLISNLYNGSYYVFATTIGDYEAEDQQGRTEANTLDSRNLPYVAYYGWNGTGTDTPNPVTIAGGSPVAGIDMTLVDKTVMRLLSYTPVDGATGISSSDATLTFTFNLPLNTDINDESIEDFFSRSIQLNVVPAPQSEAPPFPQFADFGRTVILTTPLPENTFFSAFIMHASDMLGEGFSEENMTFENPTAFGFSTAGALPAGSVSGTVQIPEGDFKFIMVVLRDTASGGNENGDDNGDDNGNGNGDDKGIDTGDNKGNDNGNDNSSGGNGNSEGNDEENWRSATFVDLSDGTYSMRAPDGTYYPYALGKVGSNYEDRWVRAPYDPDGDGEPNSIVVSGGSVSGIDINLASSSLIDVAGVVRSEEKRPVARAYVEIYDEGAGYWNSTTTNVGGVFRFSDVPTGQYRVRVNPPEGLELESRELEIRVVNRNVVLNITLSSFGMHYRLGVDSTAVTYPIQIQDARLDGMSLEFGDEIAVIAAREYVSEDDEHGEDNGNGNGNDEEDGGDNARNVVRHGEIVAGAAAFNGSYPVHIAARKDDPATAAKDGYADGDIIYFEIWRKSIDREMKAMATYGEGDGRFGSGAGTTVTLLEASRKNLGEFVREIVSELQERVKVTFEDNSAVAVRFRTGDVTGGELTMRGIGAQLADTIRTRLQDTLRAVAGYYDIHTSLSDTFTADLSVEYTEEMLAQAGIDEDDLILAWYDSTADRWKSVPTQVDVVNRIATAITNHFSLWALTDSTDEIITDVEDVHHVSDVPEQFKLLQNYPNPFNPTTTIRYELKNAVYVTLSVYNILGQRVRTLVGAQLPAGSYQILWDSRSDAGVPVSSGIYFYRLDTGLYVETRKMILMR